MKGLLENRLRDIEDVDPASTAILAIHWQKDIVQIGPFGRMFAPVVQSKGLVPRAAKVLAAARARGALVVYVNIGFRPGYVGLPLNNALFSTARRSGTQILGTPGVGVIDDLAPQPQDVQVDHGYISAFFGCDLLNVLLTRGIDTVAFTGVATNVAVDHSVRDAVQYGFRTILLEDCCCSADQAHHDAALMTLRVLSTAIMSADTFLQLLEKSPNK